MLWRTAVPAAVSLEGMTLIAVFVTAAQVETLPIIRNMGLFGYDHLLKAVFCSSSVCGGPPTQVRRRSGNRPEYLIQSFEAHLSRLAYCPAGSTGVFPGCVCLGQGPWQEEALLEPEL